MEYTGSNEYELTMCMELITEKADEETPDALKAVKKKWENEKYLQVSSKLELPNIFYVLEANANI